MNNRNPHIHQKYLFLFKSLHFFNYTLRYFIFTHAILKSPYLIRILLFVLYALLWQKKILLYINKKFCTKTAPDTMWVKSLYHHHKNVKKRREREKFFFFLILLLRPQNKTAHYKLSFKQRWFFIPLLPPHESCTLEMSTIMRFSEIGVLLLSDPAFKLNYLRTQKSFCQLASE